MLLVSVLTTADCEILGANLRKERSGSRRRWGRIGGLRIV